MLRGNLILIENPENSVVLRVGEKVILSALSLSVSQVGTRALFWSARCYVISQTSWPGWKPEPGSPGLVNMSYHSSRMPGAGGRGLARGSWCPSWSPSPGRPRSLEAARRWGGAWRGGAHRPARTRWAEAWSPASVPGRAGRSACCPRGPRGCPRRGCPPRGCEGDQGVRCCGREAVEACTSSPAISTYYCQASPGLGTLFWKLNNANKRVSYGSNDSTPIPSIPLWICQVFDKARSLVELYEQ